MGHACELVKVVLKPVVPGTLTSSVVMGGLAPELQISSTVRNVTPPLVLLSVFVKLRITLPELLTD
jgi:hypothetical protein